MNVLIDTVRIANFRGIKEVEVNLSPTTLLVGANNAGKMADPACPFQGEVPSCASMLSTVIAPAMAAPAALTTLPLNRHRAEEEEVAPNMPLAVFVPICAIELCEPIAATPSVSRSERRKTCRTS